MKNIFIVSLLIGLITACGTAPRFTSRSRGVRPSYTSERFGRFTRSDALETQIGTASFYADQFHNKITYSGEVYDMYGYSAAHPSYPMGTIIRVINRSNDRSIIIPVNDRMPFRPDRIIDLSYGTAEELDMVNDGLAEVIVEVLEWGNGRK